MLRRQLESLPGVGQVMIVGGQARQINVQLDALKLRSPPPDGGRRRPGPAVAEPPGARRLGQGGQREYTLRTMGRVDRVAELEQIARGQRTAGTRSPSATWAASRTAPRRSRASPASTTPPRCCLNIRKQSGTNTVEVARLLKERLADLQKRRPGGLPHHAWSATSRSSSRRRSTRSRST